MTTISEHTDADGDVVKVQTPTRGDGADVALYIDTAEDGAYLDRPAVDRLRAALAPYGTNREAPAETGNPAAILDYVDPDGDTMTVYTRTNPAEPLVLMVNADNTAESVNLTPDAVTRLRAALKPYDPAEKDAAPAELKPGDRARVTGDSAEWGHGFRAGDVVTLVHRGDNYRDDDDRPRGWICQAADGPTDWYVHADDLAPLDEPATLATDDAVAALRARLGTLTGAPQVAATVLDEAHVWTATTAAPDLDPRRVAAVAKALDLFGESVFVDEVSAADVLAVAAYLIGEESA